MAGFCTTTGMLALALPIRSTPTHTTSRVATLSKRIYASKLCFRQCSERSNPEDFYQWFLRKSLKPAFRPRPLLWVQNLSVSNSEVAVPQQLRSDPVDFFRGTNEDLDAAGKCLELFTATQFASGLSKPLMRHTFDKTYPGSLAILWYLRNRGYDRFDLLLQPRFLIGTVFCLVAERSDRHILSWLSNGHLAEHSKGWVAAEQIQWKGVALRQAVEAKLFWPDDFATGFHDGLDFFLHSFDPSLDTGDPERPTRRIPKCAAGSWLYKQLADRSRTAHSEDHDTFVNHLPIWNKHEAEQQWRLAHLHLAHPANPDGGALFRFFQNVETFSKTAFLEDLLHPKDSRVASVVFWTIVEAAQQLEQHRRPGDARWLLDFGQSMLPGYFTQRHYNPYRDLHRLGAVRADTRETEMKEGAAAVEHGEFKASERHDRVRSALSAYRYESKE